MMKSASYWVLFIVFVVLVLALINTPGLAAPSQQATPRPTSTTKACHICDEIPIADTQTPTPTTDPASGIVRVILFWTQSCGHCDYVLNEVLPPLQSRYGEQLKIHLIEAKSVQDFDRIYEIAALFEIDKNAVGVPLLVIGNQVLVGSDQIPNKLPELVEKYLAQGGAGIPDSVRNLLPNLMPEKVTIYLFWGDGCSHCEQARPALKALAQRNPNVELREYEVWYQADNQAVFTQMAAAFGFEPQYVPTIVIGERYWEGYSDNIQSEIETAISACLASGCPDAGLGIVPADAAENDAQSNAITNGSAEAIAQEQPDGFGLAILAIVMMVAALVYSGISMIKAMSQKQNARAKMRRKQKPTAAISPERWRNWVFVGLCMLGLVVAGYLAYVETQAVPAACGPVGDCNAVQSSSYARLFEFLPVGVLGVIGYLAILVIWSYPRLRNDRGAVYSPVLVFGMLFFGVVFSLYLTFLELFVINAVCMWCVSSAVIMTLLLLLSLKPATQTSLVLQ